jgi:ABC-type branched-subunit amino acid transport system substrate-binding protein
MSHRPVRALVVVAALAATVALAACGKSSSSSSGSTKQGSIKAGPGVTSKQITLGVLTDLSGVFAPLGQALTQGQQAYWQDQNAAGGVCQRKVKLIVKDHGYDPQKAVTEYRDVSSNILALQQLLGSPVTAALLPQLERDSMYAGLSAWPPSLLGSKEIEITGATYDLEAINGVDWLMKNKGLKSGDKIGDVYFEGDYGEGGLKGIQYAAQKHGLTVVQQKIKATDTDMSGQVSALKRAGVKAIWVTTGPKQLASVAGVAASQGLNVPIAGNNPVFSPLLLQTPVGPVLEKNLTVFSGTAPISLDKPAVAKVASSFKKHYPKGLGQGAVVAGWAESEVMNQVLQKACANKDLTRQGVVSALHSIGNLDTGGLIAEPMDFTKLGQPSEKAVYVLGIDKSAAGGAKVIEGPYTSPTAKAFQESGS